MGLLKFISPFQVDKAVVLCYKPGEISQALLAFVTTKELISEHQIEIMLRDTLTNYMIPQVVLVESIPLLVNGKIDRQALLKMYENTNNNGNSCLFLNSITLVMKKIFLDDTSIPEIEISYEGVPCHQQKAAKDLFETVGAILGRSARSAISVNSNFYEIGGNSLNSIFTISRLIEKGYHISKLSSKTKPKSRVIGIYFLFVLDIGDFISAIDFGEVLQRMTEDMKITKQPPSFTSELLKPQHKLSVLE